MAARVCSALREAADSAEAPRFYEGLLAFSRSPIPFGDAYEDWREARARAMESGKEISYCGLPSD